MFDIGPSPFDVRLVAFRIPIRVHWSFWLGAILLGWIPEHHELTFICVVCMFFSILVHELGHALTAESFGWASHIIMYFGGGLAISDRHRNNTYGRSIIVSLMGPGAGFLLYGLVRIVEATLDANQIAVNNYVFAAFFFLKLINLWWGLVNLLPVLPLDGGNICAATCQLLRLRNAEAMTLTIGVVTAGLAAAFFFIVHQQFAGIMMVMFALQNVAGLQSRR